MICVHSGLTVRFPSWTKIIFPAQFLLIISLSFMGRTVVPWQSQPRKGWPPQFHLSRKRIRWLLKLHRYHGCRGQDSPPILTTVGRSKLLFLYTKVIFVINDGSGLDISALSPWDQPSRCFVQAHLVFPSTAKDVLFYSASTHSTKTTMKCWEGNLCFAGKHRDGSLCKPLKTSRFNSPPWSEWPWCSVLIKSFWFSVTSDRE